MDSQEIRFFKGWAIPGPEVPGSQGSGLEGPQPQETLDALSGHFKIFQLKEGHRFSTDDLLVAWYGTLSCPTAHRVLDLGSGLGSVGMIAAWRLPGAQFTTLEAQEVSVQLARKSARWNGIENRYEIRQGDFRDPKLLAADESFDLILGSPPYFPLENGILAEHPQKIACRFEMRGTVADYCQIASQHLNAAGVFSCVFPIQPAHQAQRVVDAARDSGLVVIRQRSVVLKEGELPLLGLFTMMRSDHLPEKLRSQTYVEPDLIIRCKDGTIHPEYRVVKLSIGFPP